MALTLSLAHADSQDVDADALLVPVDGAICRLGGAAANALRAALPAAERADELAFLADELLAMRPLADGEARVVADVARWRWLVVSAAYPHDVDGRTFTAGDLRRAVARGDAAGVRGRGRGGGVVDRDHRDRDGVSHPR